MIDKKRLSLLIFIIVLTVIAFIVSLASSLVAPQKENLQNNPVNVTRQDLGLGAVSGSGMIYKGDKGENSFMLFTGIFLGSLIIFELALVLEVVARKKRIKVTVDDNYLSEKKREEIRAKLIGRLDKLVYQYDDMVEKTQGTKYQSERLLLPHSNKK